MDSNTPLRIFKPYADKAGNWRWRCKARNGRTVSVSGESFDSQRNAVRAATNEALLYPAGVAVVKAL